MSKKYNFLDGIRRRRRFRECLRILRMEREVSLEENRGIKQRILSKTKGVFFVHLFQGREEYESAEITLRSGWIAKDENPTGPVIDSVVFDAITQLLKEEGAGITQPQ